MSLFKLAYSNFKRSVKNYVALIISLSFSIFTFFNFQNIVFSNAMDVLKEKNSDLSSFLSGMRQMFFYHSVKKKLEFLLLWDWIM